MLAVVRPDSWNWALFIHIAGAMALVGSLVIASYTLKIARDRGDQPAAKFAFNVLLRGTLPAYLVMRVGAQLIVSKEHLDKNSPDWVGIGFAVSDVGLLLLIVGLVLSGLIARRAGRGQSVAGAMQLRVVSAISGLLLVAYIVAIWAMTTKPGS